MPFSPLFRGRVARTKKKNDGTLVLASLLEHLGYVP